MQIISPKPTSQNGFGLLYVLVPVTLIVLAGSGLYVWGRQHTNNATNTSTHEPATNPNPTQSSDTSCGTATDPKTKSRYQQCSIIVEFSSKNVADSLVSQAKLSYKTVYDHGAFITSVTVPSGKEQYYIDYFLNQPNVVRASLNTVNTVESNP